MSKSQPDDPTPPGEPRRLPKEIWVLGFGSMLMDTSSELVHSLLPVYMTTVLGASMVTVGLIEGVAEASAAVVKVFSGFLSDYLKKRKWIVVLGYGLSALTKPVFPLANTIGWVFQARFVDRIGKGIRGAPRDALVADITPPESRGAAFGLRQALDSAGALSGPLLALCFMILFAGDIQSSLWVAVVPGVLAPLLLAIAVSEKQKPENTSARIQPVAKKPPWAPGHLPLRYWLVTLLGALFTLARFSEAFLVLRAQESGLELAYVPVVLIVMNFFYSSFAYPAGLGADRFSARSLLLIGLGTLIAADLILALAASSWMVLLGAAFWGLHMALTHGLFAKLVAGTAPAEVRATAFGIFNMITGAVLFPASFLAGILWDSFGPQAAFFTGAVLAALVSLGLLFYRR